jgi:hypothetical protein
VTADELARGGHPAPIGGARRGERGCHRPGVGGVAAAIVASVIALRNAGVPHRRASSGRRANCGRSQLTQQLLNAERTQRTDQSCPGPLIPSDDKVSAATVRERCEDAPHAPRISDLSFELKILALRSLQ